MKSRLVLLLKGSAAYRLRGQLVRDRDMHLRWMSDVPRWKKRSSTALTEPLGRLQRSGSALKVARIYGGCGEAWRLRISACAPMEKMDIQFLSHW
jgi:hypothetical protein